MKKELIKTVLGMDAECFTDEYVEVEFKKCYELVEKIMGILDQDEKELLLKMSNDYDDMYKFIKYFMGGKK